MNAQIIPHNISDAFLKKLIKTARKKFDIPAIVISTMDSQGVQAAHLAGNRVHDGEQEVSLDEYFHIGSCSKMVLSLIAGKLVDEGKIQWETRFFDVFPELEKQSREEYGQINLEDLLLCEAGIKAYTGADESFPDLDKNSDNKVYDFIKYLLQLETSAQRKTSGKFVHHYSNASYTMASSMLEKTLGQDYDEMVKGALGEMGLEVITGWPVDFDKNQPWGHIVTPQKTIKFAPGHEYKLPELIKPAGDLSLKPKDFSQLVLMNLQGLRGRDTFVKSQTCQTIHFAYKGFSLGVGNGELEGRKFSGINGSAGTFFTQAMIFPGEDFALTIMMNAGSGSGRMPAVEWITTKILKQQFNWWYRFWL